MALSGLEQRIPPLGNTFLDFPASGHAKSVLSPQTAASGTAMRRSRSFAGYSPWRLSKSLPEQGEKKAHMELRQPQSPTYTYEPTPTDFEPTTTKRFEEQIARENERCMAAEAAQREQMPIVQVALAESLWQYGTPIGLQERQWQQQQHCVAGTQEPFRTMLSTVPPMPAQSRLASQPCPPSLPIGRIGFSVPHEVGPMGPPECNTVALASQSFQTSIRSLADVGSRSPVPDLTTSHARQLATSPVSSQCGDASPAWMADVTTLMIRNLPLTLKQKELLQELDCSSFAGTYDFVYMPCSFQSGQGKGFAFVNLTTADVASELVCAWHRTRRFGMKASDPALNLSAAEIQGLDGNMNKWSTPRMRRIRNPNLRPFTIGDPTPRQQRESPTFTTHHEEQQSSSEFFRTVAGSPSCSAQTDAQMPRGLPLERRADSEFLLDCHEDA